MAEVYDTVPASYFPAGLKTILDTDTGSLKSRRGYSLERFIGIHEDVQRKVIMEGHAIQQRATFRMSAAQQRRTMQLRETLAEAIKGGDPQTITEAQDNLSEYLRNRTQVTADRSDIDFYITLYREDGRELHVETNNEFGRGGLHILKQSLTG